MLDSLPDFYKESLLINELINTQVAEMDALAFDLKDILFQFFVERATWGLDHWEKIYDLPTDSSLTYDERRGRIKAKMRGSGMVTKDMIKNLAESYVNGSVEITENFSNYEIMCKFVGERGVPTNVDIVRTSLREFIPAHLVLSFAYTYLTFAEMDNHTWSELETKSDGTNFTWGELETAFLDNMPA
jgi:hypothetical protein